jgi:hypothetical protein
MPDTIPKAVAEGLWRTLLDEDAADRKSCFGNRESHLVAITGKSRIEYMDEAKQELAGRSNQPISTRWVAWKYAARRLLEMHQIGTITLRGLVRICGERHAIWSSEQRAPPSAVKHTTAVASPSAAAPEAAEQSFVIAPAVKAVATAAEADVGEQQSPTACSRSEAGLESDGDSKRPRKTAATDDVLKEHSLRNASHEHLFAIKFRSVEASLELQLLEPPKPGDMSDKENHSEQMLRVVLAALFPALKGCTTIWEGDVDELIEKALFTWANKDENFHSAITTIHKRVRQATDYSKKDWWAEYLDGCLDDINPKRDAIGTYLKADGTILRASETRFRAKGCDERHAGYEVIITNTTPTERRAVRSPIVSMLALMACASDAASSPWLIPAADQDRAKQMLNTRQQQSKKRKRS